MSISVALVTMISWLIDFMIDFMISLLIALVPKLIVRQAHAGKKRKMADIYMVGEMVQNSQNLYSFAFIDFILIHEYIYSHSTTKLSFNIYTNS